MKIKKIHIDQFRHFINQDICFDPYVTVLVGKNDTGKTNILFRLIEQNIAGGGGFSFDVSQLASRTQTGIKYNVIWNVESEDYNSTSFNDLLNNKRPAEINIITQQFTGDLKEEPLCLYADSEKIGIYRETAQRSFTPGMIKFKAESLPIIRYIDLNREKLILESIFTAYFYQDKHSKSQGSYIIIDTDITRRDRSDLTPTASILLSLVGLKAYIRDSDYKTSWSEGNTGNLLLDKAVIEEKLSELSAKITDALRSWWHDPPGLKFVIKSKGFNDAQERGFLLEARITDDDGLHYYSTGLKWFVTFLIEYLFIKEKMKREAIILFDEPASNLHPSAQRVVVKMLNDLSWNHQIIYSTHSPFLIDWNFPQRIRLLERGADKSITINNKPYDPQKGFNNIWDPLKNSIGVSLGDLGFLGEKNILVEGVSDQIILANVSAYLQSKRLSHLDLTEISIIPCNSDSLQYLIRIAKTQAKKVVVLYDNDQEGKNRVGIANSERVPALGINGAINGCNGSKNNSIEDLIGIEAYLEIVNKCYNTSIKANDLGNSSDTLGRKVKNYFDSKDKPFSKVNPAVYYANLLLAGNIIISSEFQTLISELNKTLCPQPLTPAP